MYRVTVTPGGTPCNGIERKIAPAPPPQVLRFQDFISESKWKEREMCHFDMKVLKAQFNSMTS